MIRKHTYSLDQFLVITHDGARIAKSTQVFSGIEAKAGGVTYRTDASAPPSGAMGLRGIFDHFQSMTFCNFHNRVHFARLPVEMDRNDRLRTRRDRRFQ